MTTTVEQPGLFGGYLSSKCGICGRPLSNPVSMTRGIGPICARKHVNQEETQVGEFSDGYIDHPYWDKIILQRDAGRMEGGRVFTNVPHLVTHHSPSGFEFGYGGSGPADLALNIMELAARDVLDADQSVVELWGPDGSFQQRCSREAWVLHQDFKWEFIAGLPEEGGEIPWQQIVEWVQANARVWEMA